MAAPPPYEQSSYPTKPGESQPPYPAAQPYPTAQAYPPAPAVGVQQAYPAAPAQVAYPAGVVVAAPAQAAVTNTTVVVTGGGGFLGPYPVTTTCGNCSHTVTTRITQTPGCLAWLLCCLLAFVGCWMGCCLIPFCLPDMQDTTHHCPNCGQLIGHHRRM